MRSRGIVAALIVVALAVGGCGGPQPTTADGPKPFRLTFIASQSGPLAPYTAYILDSAAAAVKQVNAGGGLLGRQVELDVRDDGTEPTKAVNVAQDVLSGDELPDILIPGLFSATTLPILPVATRAKMFTVSVATSVAGNDPAKYPYNFGAQATANDFVAGIVKHLQEAGVGRVAIATADNETGHSTVTSLQQAVGSAGITITGTQFLNPSTVDATAALSGLQADDPQQLLVVGISGQLVGTILKDRAKLGWTVPVVTDATTSANDLVALAGGQQNLTGVLCEGLPYTIAGNALRGTPAFDLFARSYLSTVSKPTVTIGTMQAGWSAVAFIQGIVQKAGSTDPDALKKAAESLQISDMPLWFSTSGDLGLSPSNHYVRFAQQLFVPAGPLDETGSLVPPTS